MAPSAKASYLGSRVRIIQRSHPNCGCEGKCIEVHRSWLTLKLGGVSGQVHVRSGKRNVLRLGQGQQERKTGTVSNAKSQVQKARKSDTVKGKRPAAHQTPAKRDGKVKKVIKTQTIKSKRPAAHQTAARRDAKVQRVIKDAAIQRKRPAAHQTAAKRDAKVQREIKDAMSQRKRPAAHQMDVKRDDAGDTEVDETATSMTKRPAAHQQAVPQISSEREAISSCYTDLSPHFSVGQRVVYTPAVGRPRLGKVAFVGILRKQMPNQLMVGLEMDAPWPDQHDGVHSATSQRHFRCAEGRGLYVSASSVRLRPVEIAAAKSRRAAEKIKKLRLGLESLQEQTTLETARLQRQAETTMCTAAVSTPSYRKRWDAFAQQYLYFQRGQSLRCGQVSAPPGASVVSTEGGPDASEESQTKVEGRRGPLLTSIERGQVSMDEAHAIFQHCSEKWKEPLDPDMLLALVRAGRERFAQEPSVLRLSVPKEGRLLVFGDTHGHLKDVVHVWRQQGLPTSQRVYLFNGDICDRGDSDQRGGQQALHIWAMMLSFKLASTCSVYMTRGNHEDVSYWPDYEEQGFRGEIESKYDPHVADKLNEAFGDLCESLPLAAVIDERCLVVHAGLPRYKEGRAHCGLQEIDRIRRPLPIPAAAPLPEGALEIPASASDDDREATILYDLTWSDPQSEPGIGENDRGPSCISFGPDVTQSFLLSEGLGMVVRSHEVPGRGLRRFEDRGFEWWHPIPAETPRAQQPRPLLATQEGWCLTLFTASDYCGYHESNNGAVLAFDGSVSNFQVVEHTGDEAEQSLLGARLDKSPLVRAEEQSQTEGRFDRALLELIVRHKHELLREFLKADERRDFHLPLPAWLGCCCRVLPRIPWEHYAGNPRIAPVLGDRVSYLSFLMRYQVRFRSRLGRHSGFRRQLTDRLFEGLMKADRSLRESLDLLDSDRDGTVSVKDFARALSSFGIVLAEGQIAMLYKTTIACHDKLLPEDVLGALSVRFSMRNARQTTDADVSAPRHLELACRDLLETAPPGQSLPQVLRAFFEQADTNQNGFLELPEIVEAFRTLPSCGGLEASQLQAMAAFVDVTGDGRVNYPELLAALCVRRSETEVKDMSGSDDEVSIEVESREQFWRIQLEAIYRCRNSLKLPDVPRLMEQHRGSEAALYKKVCERYGLNQSKLYVDPAACNGEATALETRTKVDATGNGRGLGPDVLLEDVLETIYRVLRFEYAKPLRMMLRHQLPSGCRRCTPELFGRSLLALAESAAASQLNSQQISLLVESLDVDEAVDGEPASFDFEEFFESFSIVDTLAGED
eukprot:TRINITY_DN72847_c0_g1_i1.p1 TRINITY_DN72847_c0_g1~~TRINITY_DN72847_c0_g1_i1.p1  ORF type:complete len:1307 (-),score=201.10 TRINITY_DN72847_c0_g1_i1:507-4427(-)